MQLAGVASWGPGDEIAFDGGSETGDQKRRRRR